MGKLEQLVDVLHRGGAVKAILSARRHLPLPLLLVLTYHRVGKPDPDSPLDQAVFDATPEQFDEQLAFLSTHFSFVGMGQVLDALEGGHLPPNPVLITFDDGYRDCLDVALPILERHGAKATFFIATDYTERRRIFWWDRINMIVKRATRTDVVISFPRRIELDLGSHRAEAIGTLLKLVKNHYALDLEQFLEGLADACGVKWDVDEEREIADGLLMTWPQIRALGQQGMDVQSHTRTHRVLGTLTDQMLADELGGSRRELEAQLKQPVRTVAYPVGYSVLPNDRVCRALAAAGYSAGFTNATGVTTLTPKPHRYDLRRVAMDVEFTPAFFESISALPQFARSRAAH